MTKSLQHLLIMLLFAHCPSVSAQKDSVARSSITLQNVTVKSFRQTLQLKSTAGGDVKWNMDMIDNLPKTLGSADPLHYAQLLPGIQTNGELRGGVNIYGCDNSHNEVSIGEVPIYGACHLLGLYSVFNALHYPALNLCRSASSASSPNRLGGELMMEVQSAPADTFSADISVGLLASQGTIRIPLGKKTTLITSLRGTYINLLYGNWLDTENMTTRYSFYDGNLTLIHRLDDRNTLIFDYYGGTDNANILDKNYSATIKSRWGNQKVSAHHIYTGKDISIDNILYFTHYSNNFHFDMMDYKGKVPSSISDIAYKGKFVWKRLSGGLHLIKHRIVPQYVESTGGVHISDSEKEVTNTFEASMFLDYHQPIFSQLSFNVGARGTIYGSKGTGWFKNVDPSTSLVYDNGTLQLAATYAMRHQYLLQTGLSDAGLPTEFWLSADSRFRPQYSHSFNLGSSVRFSDNRYKIEANIFYKRLFNQMEYIGSVLDLVDTQYDIEKSVARGKGSNYGLSLMCSKNTGRLTGWVSYTYTHTQRQFDSPDLQDVYPANHERPHEVDALAAYRLNRHWDFSATVVYASGTPFTSIMYLAMVNRNIIAQFGKHNGSRLSPYFRLDFSVNYRWRCRFAKENGVNLSLYNATCHSNQVFFHLNSKSDGTFSYGAKSFIDIVLPSVSYFIKF